MSKNKDNQWLCYAFVWFGMVDWGKPAVDLKEMPFHEEKKMFYTASFVEDDDLC